MHNLTLLNTDDAAVVFETARTVDGLLIGFATLNAPKSLNALNFEMIELLESQLTAWAGDTNIAMVVIKGAGEKAFCAGGDVVSLHHAMAHGEPSSLVEAFFTQEYRLDYLIHCYEKPILVWGNGIVMGGGLGLMAGASHRVVTDTSRIAMPEQTIGLYPDVGGSYFLHKMPESVGLFLGLTSASINCDDARFVSLADHYVSSDKFNEMMGALLNIQWTNIASDNHTMLSELLAECDKNSSAMPVGNIKANLKIIQKLAEFTTLQAQVDFILHLNTDDKWLLRAQKSLKHGCPLSCAVLSQQLKNSKGKSLLECFKMELGMSVRAGEVGEFQEGVRALLIDKDGTPNWQYKTLSDVPSSVVDSFFENRFGSKHPLDANTTQTNKKAML
jgi:enoyl-CoA hydratase/carnithine racemase